MTIHDRQTARAKAIGLELREAEQEPMFQAYLNGECVTAPMTQQETFWFIEGYIRGYMRAEQENTK